MLSVPDSEGVYCFVCGFGSQNLQNGFVDGAKPYKQSWEDFSPYTGNWKTYVFNSNSATSLSDITDLSWSFPYWQLRPYDSGNYMYTRDWSTSIQTTPFTGRSTPVTYGVKQYICFKLLVYNELVVCPIVCIEEVGKIPPAFAASAVDDARNILTAVFD